MRLVVVESPFAPQTPACEGPHEGGGSHTNCRKCINIERRRWESERNLRYLRVTLADCFRHGDAPFASHAIYAQEGVLDDAVPEERQLGINAGLLWARHAEATVVYTDIGISRGMQYGLADAARAGRPVEYRQLGEGWDKSEGRK